MGPPGYRSYLALLIRDPAFCNAGERRAMLRETKRGCFDRPDTLLFAIVIAAW
jgi:hypothetical protein